MNAAKKTEECPASSSPCTWARATTWLMGISLTLGIPILAATTRHFESRADANQKAAAEASAMASDLKTSNAVLSAKLDMLQATLNEVRLDLKARK